MSKGCRHLPSGRVRRCCSISPRTPLRQRRGWCLGVRRAFRVASNAHVRRVGPQPRTATPGTANPNLAPRSTEPRADSHGVPACDRLPRLRATVRFSRTVARPRRLAATVATEPTGKNLTGHRGTLFAGAPRHLVTTSRSRRGPRTGGTSTPPPPRDSLTPLPSRAVPPPPPPPRGPPEALEFPRSPRRPRRLCRLVPVFVRRRPFPTIPTPSTPRGALRSAVAASSRRRHKAEFRPVLPPRQPAPPPARDAFFPPLPPNAPAPARRSDVHLIQFVIVPVRGNRLRERFEATATATAVPASPPSALRLAPHLRNGPAGGAEPPGSSHPVRVRGRVRGRVEVHTRLTRSRSTLAPRHPSPPTRALGTPARVHHLHSSRLREMTGGEGRGSPLGDAA